MAYHLYDIRYGKYCQIDSSPPGIFTGERTHIRVGNNEYEKAPTVSGVRRNLQAVLDTVAKKLGHTRTVCRKYYVHPDLLKLYEDNRLMKYLHELDRAEARADEEAGAGLSAEQQVLMKTLKRSIAW